MTNEEAIVIATSAIRKQIPKKPIKHYFYDRYYSVDYFYQCPNHCNDRFQKWGAVPCGTVTISRKDFDKYYKEIK